MAVSDAGERPVTDQPFCDAIAGIVRRRAQKMWSYLDAVVAGEDIEALHEMRVASRRLRAAFDLCAPCYAARPYQRFRSEINELTDQLGIVRDCDVMLAFLQHERGRVPAEEQAGLDDLIEHVTAERDRLRPALVAYLKRLEADQFPQRFRRFMRAGRRQ